MAQTIDVTGLPGPVVQDLERLVATLRQSALPEMTPADQSPPLSDEEFERLLDELSEGLPPEAVLPPDFSRADIYFDHD
jgi:hypothetical protein